MVISDRLVHAYQREYRRKFGKEISNKNAERELCDLTELVRLIKIERKNRHEK